MDAKHASPPGDQRPTDAGPSGGGFQGHATTTPTPARRSPPRACQTAMPKQNAGRAELELPPRGHQDALPQQNTGTAQLENATAASSWRTT